MVTGDPGYWDATKIEMYVLFGSTVQRVSGDMVVDYAPKIAPRLLSRSPLSTGARSALSWCSSSTELLVLAAWAV